MAAPGPLLSTPLLADTAAETVDARTVKFILQKTSARKKEEERRKEVAKQQEKKHEAKMKLLNDRVRHDLPLAEAEWAAWRQWMGLVPPPPPRPLGGGGRRGGSADFRVGCGYVADPCASVSPSTVVGAAVGVHVRSWRTRTPHPSAVVMPGWCVVTAMWAGFTLTLRGLCSVFIAVNDPTCVGSARLCADTSLWAWMRSRSLWFGAEWPRSSSTMAVVCAWLVLLVLLLALCSFLRS